MTNYVILPTTIIWKSLLGLQQQIHLCDRNFLTLKHLPRKVDWALTRVVLPSYTNHVFKDINKVLNLTASSVFIWPRYQLISVIVQESWRHLLLLDCMVQIAPQWAKIISKDCNQSTFFKHPRFEKNNHWIHEHSMIKILKN